MLTSLQSAAILAATAATPATDSLRPLLAAAPVLFRNTKTFSTLSILIPRIRQFSNKTVLFPELNEPINIEGSSRPAPLLLLLLLLLLPRGWNMDEGYANIGNNIPSSSYCKVLMRLLLILLLLFATPAAVTATAAAAVAAVVLCCYHRLSFSWRCCCSTGADAVLMPMLLILFRRQRCSGAPELCPAPAGPPPEVA